MFSARPHAACFRLLTLYFTFYLVLSRPFFYVHPSTDQAVKPRTSKTGFFLATPSEWLIALLACHQLDLGNPKSA